MTPGEQRQLREYIGIHEGREERVYRDTRGHPTVGIGFNLDRGDARERLTAVGADYAAVRDGRQALSGDQIDRLFDVTIEGAIAGARRKLERFDELPAEVRIVAIDMVFQMGEGKEGGTSGFAGWTNFRRAINEKDYSRAADVMASTGYADTYKNRAQDHMDMLRAAGGGGVGAGGVAPTTIKAQPAPASRRDPFAGAKDPKGLLPEAWRLAQSTGLQERFGQRRSSYGKSGTTHLGQPGTPGYAGEHATRKAQGASGFGVGIDLSASSAEGWSVIQGRMERMWRAGFAAWYRSKRDSAGFTPHIHAVYAGYATPNAEVAMQIREFRAGRVGFYRQPNTYFERRYPELKLPQWARDWIGSIADLRNQLTPASIDFIQQVARGASAPDPDHLRALTQGEPVSEWRLFVGGHLKRSLPIVHDMAVCPLDDWARYLGVEPPRFPRPQGEPVRIGGREYWPVRALAKATGLEVRIDGKDISVVRPSPSTQRPPVSGSLAPPQASYALPESPPALLSTAMQSPASSVGDVGAVRSLPPTMERREEFGPLSPQSRPRLGPPRPYLGPGASACVPQPLAMPGPIIVAPSPLPMPQVAMVRPASPVGLSNALIAAGLLRPPSDYNGGTVAPPVPVPLPLSEDEIDARVNAIVAARIEEYDRMALWRLSSAI